ncbi:hypothetical protein [Aerococcus viridans]|nr:hypothetical protein [Aerococcus viridans]
MKKLLIIWGEELIEFEVTMKVETTIPKGHFVHKRSRRTVKKHRINV